MCLFFVLGVTYSAQYIKRNGYEWSQAESIYKARVIDFPRERAHSTLCGLQVSAMKDSLGWREVNRKVFAYMEPSLSVQSLRPGEVLCFRGQVHEPRNFSSELPFDYARYVTMQGVSGTAYVPSDCWESIGESCPTLRERMLLKRHVLLQEYMYPTFDGAALGVLSALTLGDRNTLDEEVRTLYADAGASHVLALSGLHVGVIYMMLAFVMQWLIRKRRWRWVSDLLTVLVLWAFALLVGFSASVVRAVAMCTMYVIARWVSRDSSSLNVLLLVALVMLLACPLYLFDVGFQLSFMAMVAILSIVPYLEGLYARTSIHPVLAYVLGVLVMSLAAQLGTFPLVLYHFGTFPVYFLLTNMLVIPYLYVVLAVCAIWWLFVLCDAAIAVRFGCLLQSMVDAMNRMLAQESL